MKILNLQEKKLIGAGLVGLKCETHTYSIEIMMHIIRLC